MVRRRVERWRRKQRSQPSELPPAASGASDAPVAPPSRHELVLLADPALQRRIAEVGVARVSGAVSPEVVAQLADLYAEATAAYRGTAPPTWHATGMLQDADFNRLVHREAPRIIAPTMAQLLAPGAASVHTGSFAVKPPSPESALGMHQDVSVVDERTQFSLNIWIPLVDTDGDNGALRFVAGSHRFGNVQRSLALPWSFGDHHEAMDRHAQDLPAQRGDIIIFDTAIIHGSPANRTAAPRVALQGLVLPAGQRLEHLSVDEATPAGKVKVTLVDPIHLLDGGGGVQQPGDVSPPTYRPSIRPDPTPAEFEDWCASARRAHPLAPAG